ncbi:MAG: FKBP-type peptidyl-prolyl cis-trans isomerase [Blautia sp.]|nr:FKBP-type peptidyl-prolyl cis-trans isomerase [Blautia sp.]
MKKKILTGLLCLVMATAAACGNGAEDSRNAGTENGTETGATPAYEGVRSAQIEVEPEKLIKTLSDYKGIDVTITGDYEVTDETVEQSVLQVLSYSGADTVEVTDRDTVEAGDYVKIDYTGYKDGVAFDGGAAADVMMDVSNNLEVTSGNPYIDGFCDDLEGAKVGDELDTDVTFPEQYQSAELAGQPAVFHITVKGIYRPLTLEELTDEMVASAFAEQGVSTKEELVGSMREMLESQMSSYKMQATLNAVQTYILEHSEVEIPEEYMQARLAELEYSTAIENCQEGQTLDEFLVANGTTLEAQREVWISTLEQQIKMEILFRRIAELEQITIDEEEFTNYVNYFVQSGSGSFTTVEDVYNYYGVGDAKGGEQELRKLFLAQRGLSFVAENANVTVEGTDSGEPETESAQE